MTHSMQVSATVAAAVVGSLVATAGSAPAPIATLLPSLQMTASERARLDAGQAVVQVLPAADRELGVVAAIRTSTSPERLLAWTERIADFQRSRYIPLVQEFSSPPRVEDVAALRLEDGDMDDLRSCEPGDCAVKLSAGEMLRLRAHLAAASTYAVQEEFRRLFVERARDYLSAGDSGLAPYHDDMAPVAPDVITAGLLDRLGLAHSHLAGIAEYLQMFPRIEHPHVAGSRLYWAKETLGGAKPIASITHVTLLRSADPECTTAVTLSKQVFASHYRDGAVSMMAITGTVGNRYLVYVHRSRVDVLHGAFGGLVRGVIERRVRDEAPALLMALRTRLEGGDPP